MIMILTLSIITTILTLDVNILLYLKEKKYARNGGQVLRFEFGLCKLKMHCEISPTAIFYESNILKMQDLAPLFFITFRNYRKDFLQIDL